VSTETAKKQQQGNLATKGKCKIVSRHLKLRNKKVAGAFVVVGIQQGTNDTGASSR
jgi:hypothetical protein